MTDSLPSPSVARRTTLLDQHVAITEARQAAARKIIVDHFGRMPDVVYMTGYRPTNFEPEAWAVTGVSAAMVPGTWFDRRPTKKNIAAFANAAPVTIDTVCLHVKAGNQSMGVKISELNERWSLDKSIMDAKSAKLRAHYITGPDQFNCRYCGKATNLSAKVTHTIIARQYPNFQKAFDYCSGKCATHDQYAHEG